MPRANDIRSANFAVNLETLVDHLIRLALLFNVSLTEDTIDLYMVALEDLTPDQLTTGLRRVVREATFFPVPAELREFCTGVPSRWKASMTGSLAANKQWTLASKWARWWLEGNHYELTLQGHQPVIYIFTNRSLKAGLNACGLRRELKTLYQKLDEAKVTRDAYERLHFPGAGTKHLALADKLIAQHQAEIGVTTADLAHALETGDPLHGAFLESEITRLKTQLADWESRRTRALARSAADGSTIARRREELDGAIEGAKAGVKAAEDACLFCRLCVEMPPRMSPILEKTLLQLNTTIGAALQRFTAAGDDKHLRHNFDEKAREVIAAHASQESYLPRTRQLTGAVQSDDETRVCRGVFRISHEGDATYYSTDDLRKAQAAGAVISEEDIEAQLDFLTNITEILIAPHSPAPTPKAKHRSVLSYTSHEDDLARGFAIQAERDARSEALQAANEADYELASELKEIEPWTNN